jgi:hypothetical protein
VSTTVGATAVPVPFSLEKGVRFIVGVHDPNQLLPQAEAVPGAAVSASVASASVSQFLLPVVYGDGLVRDYGTVVPTNVPMSVTISSATVVLADGTGTALAPTAVTFEALQGDLGFAPGAPSQFASMFPPQDAKMIHVYATALSTAVPGNTR